MHALKSGLNIDTFATFSERFYHSFVLQMTLIHSRSRRTQVHLHDFETHENV